MPWFKVDDGWWSHPKVLALSDAAQALWVRAGSYSMKHLTDGSIPVAALGMLRARKRIADELVAAGLWDVDGGGYQFHDWDEYQPSRESVMADRAAGSARQAVARNPDLRSAVRNRDNDQCRYCGTFVAWNDRRGSGGGTYDHVIPNGGSTLENLVVCCRGCNSRKGRRTPEQAGMKLNPSPGSRSVLDTPSSPSQPNPTQPTRSPKKESQGGTTGGVEPPLFCSEHPFGGAGKCGPCGDARKAHARWERERSKPPSLKRPRKGDGHDCIDDGNGWCSKCGEKTA